MTEQTYQVRVSRWLLLFVFIIAFVIFLVGMDLTFFHRAFDTVDTDSPILLWLFKIGSIVFGLIITINQIYYLFRPPLMIEVSKNGISFGTGFRYRQILIPLKYIEKVSKSSRGVENKFKESTEISNSLTTSAGISYINYTLALLRHYPDQRPRKIVKNIQQFIHQI